MGEKAKISYREFYDVPRVFIIHHRGLNLLFDSKFDESRDDYLPDYEVYVLPANFDEQREASWQDLPSIATKHVGRIPVGAIVFDTTKRAEIDTAVVDRLLDAEVA